MVIKAFGQYPVPLLETICNCVLAGTGFTGMIRGSWFVLFEDLDRSHWTGWGALICEDGSSRISATL